MKRRKRGAYHTKLTKRELDEINELNTKLSERDGHLKYQALLDWYRSKKSWSGELRVGSPLYPVREAMGGINLLIPHKGGQGG